MKKILLFILRISVSAGIIIALFKFIPYQNLIELYRQSVKSYIVLGFCMFLIIHGIAVARWRFILRSLGLRIPLREASYAFFSGLFFNLFFPSLLAGDVFRSAAISYRHKNTAKVVSSVFMDRFSGSIGLALVALIAFIASGELVCEKSILWVMLIFLGFIFLCVLTVFNSGFFSFLKTYVRHEFIQNALVHFHEEMKFFKKTPKVFFQSILFSFIIQGASCIIFYIFSRALLININIMYFFMLVPLIQFIATLPVTIAGMGTRELAAVYFFSKIGIAESVSLSMSFLLLLFMIMMSIAGGFIYVVVYHRWLECHLQNTVGKE